MNRARILAPVIVAVIVAAGAAMALDVADVQNLLRNQVSEDVIINMVESDGTLFITMEEANVLRSLGASENLIDELRPTPLTTSSVSVPAGAYVPEPMAVEMETDGSVVAGERIVAVPTGPAQVVTTGPVPADGSPITPAPITSSTAFPPRYDKEGWVSFFNRDWVPYYINIVPGNKRIFLSRTPNGGILIESGQNLVVNLRKETYKMYGDTGEDLKVRVRENETTTVSLNPYGVFGNSGLTAVATDRDRVRNEVLFAAYVPPPAVVVQPAPVMVVPAPPPPIYYHRPPYHRPYRGGGYFGFHRW